MILEGGGAQEVFLHVADSTPEVYRKQIREAVKKVLFFSGQSSKAFSPPGLVVKEQREKKEKNLTLNNQRAFGKVTI